MADEALLTELRALVGEAHVLVDRSVTAGYEQDWIRRWGGRARAVVRPADTGEVVGVVRACARHGAAIVPQGGNTGLVGGGVPRGGEVVVSLRRLDTLGDVDRASAQVSAGAGVTLERLQAHAGQAGFVYGVDLASRSSATVGGTIATNAGGVKVVRYGHTRAQIVGLEAVFADGSVVRRMGGLVKDTVGYDVPGLLIGSEGTLGLVTEARLRLWPSRAHRVVAVLAVASVRDAVRVSQALRDGLDGIEAVELFHEEGVELVVTHAGAARPFTAAHPSYLLVEVADRHDPTEDLATLLADLPEVRDAAVASDGPGRARLWRLREGHTEAISALGVPHKLDVAVTPGRLPELSARLPAVVEAAAPGARLITFGHLADGNLHVNVVGPDPLDDAVDAAVIRLVAELEGSISAEHGVGVHKAAYVPLVRGAGDRAAMAAVKRALDPAGMLNPGVLFADPPAGHG